MCDDRAKLKPRNSNPGCAISSRATEWYRTERVASGTKTLLCAVKVFDLLIRYIEFLSRSLPVAVSVSRTNP